MIFYQKFIWRFLCRIWGFDFDFLLIVPQLSWCAIGSRRISGNFFFVVILFRATVFTVTVKKMDTPHKQTNKKQPILRLLISFWFQNNRLEISFSEHIEPFHSYEYEQSYAIFSDWNDLKFLTILRFISECVVTGFPQQKKRF